MIRMLAALLLPCVSSLYAMSLARSVPHARARVLRSIVEPPKELQDEPTPVERMPRRWQSVHDCERPMRWRQMYDDEDCRILQSVEEPVRQSAAAVANVSRPYADLVPNLVTVRRGASSTASCAAAPPLCVCPSDRGRRQHRHA